MAGRPRLLHESGAGLVDLRAFRRQPFEQIVALAGAVHVPTPIEKLDETHPLLHQAAETLKKHLK